MAGEWAQAPLRDLIEITRDGEWGSDHPGVDRVEMLVVRGTDFARLRVGNLAEIPRRYIERGAAERKQLRADDVLIETAGGAKDQSTGRTALVKRSHIRRAGLPIACASFARFLRFDRTKVEPAFMYWWLQSLHASGEMETHQVQHTGVARFQFTKFAETTNAPLPPLSEQRAIAHILGTLDDKIELNRRMNETLEAIARAVFKSWFVDFDPVRAKTEGRDPGLPKHITDLFPNRFENSELGEIPAGWKVGPVLNQAKLLSGGTPKTDRAEYWDGDVLWASAKDVSQCGQTFLVEVERTITKNGLEESATQLIPCFSTVVVARGATTGRMVLFGCEMAMNQTCYGLVSTTDTPFALYCRLRFEMDDLVHAAHGSVFDTITTSTFANSKIVLPPIASLKAFEQKVSPIFRRILGATQENQILSIFRDSLLPKLVSGELRIRNTGSCSRLVGD